MSQPRRSDLKTVYFRSFAFLVIIPLLLVFIGAALVIGLLVRNASLETIDAYQDNVATTLSNDIRAAALQLTHFTYVNDGEFPATAARAYASSGNEQYNAQEALDRAFRTIVAPSQSTPSAMFYMADGGSVYMGQEIILDRQEVRGSAWYQQALQHPNQVQMGVYDSSRSQLYYTGQRDGQLLLVSAMAMDRTSDRSGKIEVLAFFSVSNASSTIREGDRDPSLGTTVLLDGQGRLLYGDFGNEAVRAYFSGGQGAFTPGTRTDSAALEGDEPRTYLFRTRAVPGTDWSVVTFLEPVRLTQGFYQVGAILLLVVAALLLSFSAFSRYFLNSIITPIHAVAEGMDQLVNNDLEVQVEPVGQQEIRTLAESFNQMVLSLKNMLRYNEEAHRRRHEAEMQALQSQINPHFIVNTLNSIRFMAQVAKFEGIQKMSEALISIVACSFRSNVSLYTVAEELQVLDSYVYLMRIRYSDSFEVRYEVEPGCGDYLLPRLILQPLVENAITHGFAGMEEELGQIEVSVYRRENELFLAVRDNGCGMTEDQRQQLLNRPPRRGNDNTSIGLENVLARLRLHFGKQAGMEVESAPGQGTEVRLHLPLDACTTKNEKEEGAHDPHADRG